MVPLKEYLSFVAPRFFSRLELVNLSLLGLVVLAFISLSFIVHPFASPVDPFHLSSPPRSPACPSCGFSCTAPPSSEPFLGGPSFFVPLFLSFIGCFDLFADTPVSTKETVFPPQPPFFPVMIYFHPPPTFPFGLDVPPPPFPA